MCNYNTKKYKALGKICYPEPQVQVVRDASLGGKHGSSSPTLPHTKTTELTPV